MRTPAGKGRAALARLALLAAVLAAPAAAAPPAAAQATVEPDTLAVEVEPLIVRALPFTIADRVVPFALSHVRIDGSDLTRPGAGLGEALRGVPGLQVDDRHTDALGDRIVLRGFGARSAFGVRGVRVLIDGHPATFADGQTDVGRLDLALLDGAQVLRGPASSLYGNAAGGVLLLETVRPPIEGTDAAAAGAVDSDGGRRAHGRVGGRNAGIGWLASVSHRWGDGFRDFSESDRTHVALDAAAALGTGSLRVTGGWLDYDARNPGALSLAQLRDDRSAANSFNVAQATGEIARQATLTARGKWPTRLGALEIGAYATDRSIENPIPPAIIDLDRLAGGARALLRPRVGTVELALGASIDAQRDDRLNFDNDGGTRGARTLDQRETVRTGALFGHALLPVGSRTTLMAGARWDAFRFAADDRFTAGDPDDSGTRTMNALSPSLGVSLRLAGDGLLYANLATAFETPTTTELANRPDGAGGLNPQLDPQRALSLELGARAEIGPTDASLAVYATRVRDALVPFEVPGAPGRQFYRNAGSADHRGLEFALQSDAGAPLRWRAAYAWTVASFDKFATASADYAGNRVPGVAPHRVEGELRAPVGPLVARLSALYSAGMWVDDANSARTNAYALVDAGVEAPLRVGPAGLTLSAGLENLLDQDYVGSVVVNAFGGRYYEPGPGRTLWLGLRLESSR